MGGSKAFGISTQLISYIYVYIYIYIYTRIYKQYTQRIRYHYRQPVGLPIEKTYRQITHIESSLPIANQCKAKRHFTPDNCHTTMLRNNQNLITIYERFHKLSCHDLQDAQCNTNSSIWDSLRNLHQEQYM